MSMEKNNFDYSPLLSPRGDETASKTLSSSLVSATKWTLKFFISVIFVLWTALFFFNLQSLCITCFQNGMSSAVILLLESQVSLSFLFLFFFTFCVA